MQTCTNISALPVSEDVSVARAAGGAGGKSKTRARSSLREYVYSLYWQMSSTLLTSLLLLQALNLFFFYYIHTQ